MSYRTLRLLLIFLLAHPPVATALPAAKNIRQRAAGTVPAAVPPFIAASAFGARGDGLTDDTAALQKALDAGRIVVLQKGTYKISHTLYLRQDNAVLEGQGPSASIIAFSGKGAAFANGSVPEKTLYWCRLSRFRIDAVNPDQRGPLIRWNSMQFGELNHLWLKGAGTNSDGILLFAIPQKTEATYNVISHSYIGLVKTGLMLGYGANSNTIETSRFQPLAGGTGIILRGQMSNNRILHCGFEYPGNVSGGVLLDGDVQNTLIEGNRFEGLAFGWKINGNSNAGTVLIGNYHDSTLPENNGINHGQHTRNLDQPAGK